MPKRSNSAQILENAAYIIRVLLLLNEMILVRYMFWEVTGHFQLLVPIGYLFFIRIKRYDLEVNFEKHSWSAWQTLL